MDLFRGLTILMAWDRARDFIGSRGRKGQGAEFRSGPLQNFGDDVAVEARCGAKAGKGRHVPLWALLDSGLASTSLFVVAMVLYLVAIPLESLPDAYTQSPNGMSLSQLWFGGALLFVLESSMDFSLNLRSRLTTGAAEPATTTGGDAGSEDAEERCAPWLDKLDWDVWAAFFFLVPSLITLTSSLLDPNIVMWEPVNVFRSAGYSNDEFTDLCAKTSAALFILDALIGLMGRYSFRRQIPSAERLILCKIWLVKGFFEIDWLAWGDLLFGIGAVIGLWQAFDDGNVPLKWATNVLWLVDGLFYVLGCMPKFRSMLKGRSLRSLSVATAEIQGSLSRPRDSVDSEWVFADGVVFFN